MGISDHNLIGCIRKMNSQKYKRKIINARNYRAYSKEEMLSDLRRVDWDLLYKLENVNTAWKFISDNLRKFFNKHAPKIEKRVKGRPCPWITNEFADCMNKRDQLLRKAEKSGRQEHWKIYKKKRNRCTKMVRKAKRDYHKRLLQENSRNPRNFWKYIKEIIPNKSKNKSSNSVPFIKSTIGNAVKSKAQVFCQFFSKIATTICKMFETNSTFHVK